MKFFPMPYRIANALLFAVALVFSTIYCQGAASLTQHIDPPEANVGDEVVVTFTVQNGSGVSIHLPPIDGLQSLGTSSATNISFNNGSFSSAYSEAFHLTPTRPGDYTIPAFDIHLQDGGVLHSLEMKLHVLGGTTAPAANPSANPPTNVPGTPAFNPNGPVVMPPGNGAAPNTPANSADTGNTSGSVPTETDGRPAKVYMTITPQTTDAYVGQSIPMRIEFFIRLDSAAPQDSLPTIKGSDFLMNTLSVRPREDQLAIMNEGYQRESWLTAISAPKKRRFFPANGTGYLLDQNIQCHGH